MTTNEQLGRIRNLAQLYVEELPEERALDNLVLIFDICEILELSTERLEAVFGAEALRWVTGLVYGEGMGATAHDGVYIAH